jgi:hypothetical protein
MTTISQVKRAVQPLLQRNPDLALAGRLVVIKPVHHILRGIFIDRSLDSNVFVPTWLVMFMFKPNDRITFNWGERIYCPDPGRWDITDPQASLLMCAEIERVALRRLRPLQTIDDIVKFASRRRFRNACLDFDERKKVYVDVACGDFKSATIRCALIAKTARVGWEQEESDKISKSLGPLLKANNRAGMAQVLRDCEAYSAKKLKLEKLWEPTPFPLELQSGQR